MDSRREYADEFTETRDPVQSTPDSESTRVQSTDSAQSTGADTQPDIRGYAVVATRSVGSEAEATDHAGGGAVPTEVGEREFTRGNIRPMVARESEREGMLCRCRATMCQICDERD